MFVAISTRSLTEVPLADALAQAVDLGFDRVDLWINDEGASLSAGEVAGDPDGFASRYREMTRLGAAAVTLAHAVTPEIFSCIAKAAKTSASLKSRFPLRKSERPSIRKLKGCRN